MVQNNNSSLFFDFFLGGFSAGLSKTIVAPIERVKLLLQLQDAKKDVKHLERYNGIIDCTKRVFKDQGFFSFWRGNLSNVIRYFPVQAINFTAKEVFKRKMPKYDAKKNFWKNFVVNLSSGGLAGALSVIIVYPLDLIRTRLAIDTGKALNDREFKGMKEVIQKIYDVDGVFGIYRGLTVSILCGFLYRALYFGLFDTGKDLLFTDFKNTNFFMVWGFAQVITLFSGYVVYPLDTIRRRLMVQSGKKEVIYTNSMDCARKIYNNEGKIFGFFKGAATNAFRGTGGALVLVIYSKIQSFLGVNSEISISG